MTLNFASLDAFHLAEDYLLQERRRLELAHACGAMLMLERAFEATPLACKVSWSVEFGDFETSLVARAPDGREAEVSSIVASLDCDWDAPEDDSTPDGSMIKAIRRLNLGAAYGQEREVAKSFSFLTVDEANALDGPFKDAMSYLSRHAPNLSYRALAAEEPAMISRADAPGLARQLGWPEAAAMIEAARLSASLSSPPGPEDASPRGGLAL